LTRTLHAISLRLHLQFIFIDHFYQDKEAAIKALILQN